MDKADQLEWFLASVNDQYVRELARRTDCTPQQQRAMGHQGILSRAAYHNHIIKNLAGYYSRHSLDECRQGFDELVQTALNLFEESPNRGRYDLKAVQKRIETALKLIDPARYYRDHPFVEPCRINTERHAAFRHEMCLG